MPLPTRHHHHHDSGNDVARAIAREGDVGVRLWGLCASGQAPREHRRLLEAVRHPKNKTVAVKKNNEPESQKRKRQRLMCTCVPLLAREVQECVCTCVVGGSDIMETASTKLRSGVGSTHCVNDRYSPLYKPPPTNTPSTQSSTALKAPREGNKGKVKRNGGKKGK